METILVNESIFSKATFRNQFHPIFKAWEDNMGTIEPVQKQAMSLLAGWQGVDGVCDALNIHRTTLWRWGKQPEFIASWN